MRLSKIVLLVLFLAAPLRAAPVLELDREAIPGDGQFIPTLYDYIVRVTPDASMLAPGGSTLELEVLFGASALPLADVRINTDAFPMAIPATNPIDGSTTSGLVADGSLFFASFASAPVTTADPIELLRFLPTEEGILSIKLEGTATQDGVSTASAEERIITPITYDGDIDVDDFGVFVHNYQTPGLPRGVIGDFDFDADVDLDDFGVFVSFFQSSFSTIVADAEGDGTGPVHVGDFDADGDVDLDDFGVFVEAYQISPPAADLNGNRILDPDDFGIFVQSFQLSPQGGPPFAPGDFDEDGDVDTDDFGAFVPSFCSCGGPQPPPPWAVADFDSDDDIDSDDFGVFVDGFQQFPPGAASVASPEPGSLLLMLIGVALAAVRGESRKG